MLNRFLTGAAVAALGISGPAGAEPVQGSANVTLTNNYMFRGVTQSDGGPAVQGGFDVSAGGAYAGVWASSVDFSDDTTMELDFYAGYTNELGGGWSYDVGAIYYAYPDSPELPTGTQNFTEVYGGLSRSFGPVDAGAMVSWSPAYYGDTGESIYASFDASIPVTDELSFSAHYGVSRFDRDDLNTDYEDFNVGLSRSIAGLDVDVRFHSTTELSGNDDAVTVAVSRSF